MSRQQQLKNPVLRQLATEAEGVHHLAKKLNVSRQSIYVWDKSHIPPFMAVQLEIATKGQLKAVDLCGQGVIERHGRINL